MNQELSTLEEAFQQQVAALREENESLETQLRKSKEAKKLYEVMAEHRLKE
jgi:hypothetical protein